MRTRSLISRTRCGATPASVGAGGSPNSKARTPNFITSSTSEGALAYRSSSGAASSRVCVSAARTKARVRVSGADGTTPRAPSSPPATRAWAMSISHARSALARLTESRYSVSACSPPCHSSAAHAPCVSRPPSSRSVSRRGPSAGASTPAQGVVRYRRYSSSAPSARSDTSIASSSASNRSSLLGKNIPSPFSLMVSSAPSGRARSLARPSERPRE
mmetsp:Transcript_12038/g.37016  ORF Transcript_12038/g.37016 Transcript_12038/m.37016 type:complete len:217 (+) Transcript_12038:497-1147(+)